MGKSKSRSTSTAGKRPRPSKTRSSRTRNLIVIGTVVIFAALAIVIGRASTGNVGGSAAEARVPDTSDLHSLLVDPEDSKRLFYGNHSGLYESKDAGKNWKAIDAMVGQDAMGLALDGNNLWAAGHNILFVSKDRGKNFQPVTAKLPGTDFHGFAAAPSKPGTMFAFVVGQGLFRTDNGGEDWALVPQKEQAVPMGIMALAVDSNDENMLYAGDMQSGLLRSMNGGQTWERTTLPASSMSLVSNPGSGKLLAATGQGLFTGEPGGDKWSQLTKEPAALVAVSGGDNNVIYTVGPQGGIKRSSDNGSTWR